MRTSKPYGFSKRTYRAKYAGNLARHLYASSAIDLYCSDSIDPIILVRNLPLVDVLLEDRWKVERSYGNGTTISTLSLSHTSGLLGRIHAYRRMAALVHGANLLLIWR